MAKSFRTGFLVIIILGAALLGGFFWWLWIQSPVQPGFSPKTDQEEQILVIKRGESLDEIALRLKEDNLVRSAFAFRLTVMAKNLTQSVQAGDFHLHPGMGLAEIISQLTHGSIDIWITFPEGWRQEQIAQKLVTEGFDIDFINWNLEIENLSHEGYLFPDTYLMPRDATAEATIEIMRNNFGKKAKPVLADINQQGFSPREALILASMVEREVRTDEDRPLVAGIILKRWQNGWPLQIDATVQYAVATVRCDVQDAGCNWWPQNLTQQDLRIDSPYNTYRFQGLPPAPICNPGLASIEAVVNYQESPYWFYLSDASGKMHYAETVEGHNANVAQYLGK